MEIEKFKSDAKSSFIISGVCLVVFTPLFFTSLLKLIYYQKRTDFFFANIVSDIFRDIVVKIYHSFDTIQFLWPISPKPSFSPFLTWGNLFTTLIFFGFLFGCFAFHVGTEALEDLNDAKRNVRKRRLENEYRNRNI